MSGGGGVELTVLLAILTFAAIVPLGVLRARRGSFPLELVPITSGFLIGRMFLAAVDHPVPAAWLLPATLLVGVSLATTRWKAGSSG